MKYIQVPEVVYTLNLSALELLIYADVHTMNTQGNQFYRSNTQLGERFGRDPRNVKRAVSKLVSMGLLIRTTENQARTLTAVTELVAITPPVIKTPPVITSPRGGDKNAPPRGDKLAPPTGDTNAPLVYKINKEVNKELSRKAKPKNLAEVIEAFVDSGSTEEEANKYYDYYTSKGWKVGRAPMKDWQAAARNWLRNANGFKTHGKPRPTENEQRDNREKLERFIKTGKV
jgi:hypothetical protein